MSKQISEAKVKAYVALALRVISLGKSMNDISPEDIKEIVDASSKEVGDGDYRAFMTHLVVINSEGGITLNF